MDIVLFLIGLLLLTQKKYAWCFVILIGLFTSYYGLGSNSSFGHTVSDTGFVFFIVMYVYGSFQGTRYKYDSFKALRPMAIILGIFLIQSVVSDLVLDSHMLWIIKTGRHWIIFFLSFSFLTFYSPDVYEKTLKYIFYISVIASLLILVNYFSGIDLLEKQEKIVASSTGTEYKRAAIPSTFTIFYILLLFTDYYKSWNIKPIYKNIFLFILALTVFASIIRSLIISIIFGIILLMLRTHKIKFTRIHKIIGVVIVMLLVMMNIKGLGDRMSEGFTEITTSTKQKSGIEVKGNMTFRLAMLEERSHYIVKDLKRFIYGVGFIPEEEFPEIFKIGLPRAHGHGDVMQLDTGDIAWALIVVRLGLIGFIVFVIFIVKLLITQFKLKHSFAKVCFSYFLILFCFQSFAGIFITSGYNYVFLFMVLALSEVYSDSEEQNLT